MSTPESTSAGTAEGPAGEPGAPVERRFVDHRRFAADARATALIGFAVYALSILTGPILARGLGPSGRGDLAAVIAPTGLIMFLLTFGIPAAASYFAPVHDRKHTLMTAWVFTGIFSTAACVLLWNWVPGFLSAHDPSVTVPWFRTFLIAGIAALPAQVAMLILLAEGQTRLFNTLKSMPQLLNTALLALLVVSGHLTLGTALGAAFVSNVVSWIAALAVVKGWPRRGFKWEVARAQYGYGAKVFPGTLANFVVSRFDQFLLVGMVSSTQLGLYAVAVNAAGVSSPITQGIMQVLAPQLRQAADPEVGRRTRDQALRWTLLSSVCIATLIAFTAPWVVPFAFGDAFKGSVVALWLMLPGQVFADTGGVFTVQLGAAGRPGLASAGVIAGAVVTVILLLPLVRHLGINGAALTTTLSQFAFMVFELVAARVALGDRPQLLPRRG